MNEKLFNKERWSLSCARVEVRCLKQTLDPFKAHIQILLVLCFSGCSFDLESVRKPQAVRIRHLKRNVQKDSLESGCVLHQLLTTAAERKVQAFSMYAAEAKISLLQNGSIWKLPLAPRRGWNWEDLQFHLATISAGCKDYKTFLQPWTLPRSGLFDYNFSSSVPITDGQSFHLRSFSAAKIDGSYVVMNFVGRAVKV